MENAEFDVIIVGARCAGATLATFLARAGASVLVVDKATLPSDQVLSTHTIHPPGIDVLDEVGVGDAIRQITPPAPVVRLRKNDAFVDLQYGDGRFEYCPRRKRLDDLLQRAAVAAGAELRDRTRVTSLIAENGRVARVRAMSEGRERTFRAPLVVGADGRHSTVANLVGAEEYLAYDAPRAMYWGYWEPPSSWNEDPAYPFGMYVGNRDGHIRVIFLTDHGHLLIGSLPVVEQALEWRADPERALIADLLSDPVTGPLVDGGRLTENVRGTLRERYFFRTGAGAGWALVGDAGHHKEFVLGDGITEALLQARSLAAAISEGSGPALTRWWRERDVEALPLHFFGQEQGAPHAPRELECVVFSRLAAFPELRARMASVMEHRVSPYDAVPIGKVIRWLLGATIRGRPRVIGDFLARGRFISAVNRELKERRRLLADLDARSH